MWTNLRGKFPIKDLKQLVFSAARAPYIAQLNHWLAEIEKQNVGAREWLRKRPTGEWSKTFFKTDVKSDILLNNLSECFNKYILEVRQKPILTMFEMIRTQLMKRINIKQEVSQKWKGLLCPKIKNKLEQIKEKSFDYTATFSGSPLVQVNGPEGQFTVDLERKTCACRRWDLTGIPCMHAVACIFEENEDSVTYVNDLYKVDTYKRVYSLIINPTNGPSLWEAHDNPGIILPPSPVKKKRGRIPTARRKEAEEKEKEKEL